MLIGLAVVILSVVLLSCATTPTTQSEINEQRASIRDMANRTLSELYGQYPGARSRVHKAAGYAVFSDFGMKFLFMGSATGHGIVINNETRHETFMKMVELQPGYGFGAQKFKVIFVFDTQAVLNNFVNSGWEFGGSTAAAAQTSTQGGGAEMGATVSPGMTMYQLSGTGAIVGVSITGAKYYKDDTLN
ncbi:MAG TPA: YSC84-related protein [Thermodesulfovibrionales bacterium]|nr:YSC84-related protein [Thermodesulfovibrionales bacterium]